MAEINLGRVKGDKGDAGADGLTTSVKLGEVSYSHVGGVISLPSYPSKTSELVNDAGFLTTYEHNHDDRYYTETEVDTKITSSAATTLQSSKDWAVGTFINPNLLINGDFRNPVNQRGQLSYSAQGYTIDRWRLNSVYGTVTINSGYISLTRTVNGTLHFYQSIEFPELLFGKRVSYSVELLNGSVYKTSDTIPTSGNIDTANAPIGTSGWILDMMGNVESKTLSLRFYNVSTMNSIDIVRVKLELGSVATPFVPRGYGEELALCQRYFQIIKVGQRIRTGFIVGDSLDFYYPIQEMRATPTFTLNGTQGVDYAVRLLDGAVQTGFVFSATAMTKTQFGLKATKTAHGLTDGQLAVTGANGEIWLDSEIY